MATKHLRTSDLARAVGIHPNTVRRYVEWGLVPPVERSPTGYRLFTQHHLDCLRLARLIYASEYPGRDLRASAHAIIQSVVLGDWNGALEKARQHLAAVRVELEQANAAAAALEHWAQNMAQDERDEPLATSAAAALLGVSVDMLRNWERNGLISVPRNAYNGYRRFGKKEIERLRIIRMLARAGYSHMAMLRMFIELDAGNTRDLKRVLDEPRPDEEIFTAADHWLTTLHGQERVSEQVVQMVAARIDSP